MRRTILPFALAPLALGAIPPGLTGPAEAQAIAPTPGMPGSQVEDRDQVGQPRTGQGVSPLPAVPVPPQARVQEPAPPAPEPPAVLDDPVVGGPEVTAEIAQRFEIDTNLDLDDPNPGTSYFTETRLAFGLIDQTPVRSFSLGFDTGVRALWPADDDFEFTVASPSTVTAGYTREWASGAFETDFRLRQRRVDFARDIFEFDPGGEIIVPDDPEELEGDATERRYDASFDLELATDSPSSYAFGLSANRIDYDETEGDLTPRTSVQGDATWILALTPTISSALSARAFYYEADNEEETEIRESELDAGFIYAPSEVLELSAGLGVVTRERKERPFGIGPVETLEEDTGATFRTGASYAFDDFVLDANLRAATAPDFRLSGNFNVTYPLSTGVVNARIFQSYAGGSGGDEIRVLGAGFGLEHELDAVTVLSFDLAATRRSNEDDPDDPDVNRFDFTTAVQYAFTETISADFGYRYRTFDEGPEEADSHAVFVQVGRSFVTGF